MPEKTRTNQAKPIWGKRAGSLVRSCPRICRISSLSSAAVEAPKGFEIPSLIMSYYNILYQYGVNRFVKYMAAGNLSGVIIPDLPPEEGQEYLQAMEQHDLCPILLFAPPTSDERLRYLASLSKGFITKGIVLLRSYRAGNSPNCKQSESIV